MKCQNCGTEFNEGLFCPECGTKYDEEQVKKESQKDELNAKAEIEKAKVEAEKLAKEKAEHEAEIAKQATEQQRLANERIEKEAELTRLKMEREQAKKDENEGKVMGILSLILGIISLGTFGVFLIPEILGIVFAFNGKKQGKMRGTSLAGLVCSIISLVIMVAVYVWAFSMG